MRKRVMILDDEKQILDMVELILHEEDYDVVAVNQYQPLEYIMDFSPELIILDIRLRNGYGHLLCKDLKANPETSDIPVLLISGSDNLEAVAADCKADGFLHKPFSLDELVSLVKQFD